MNKREDPGLTKHVGFEVVDQDEELQEEEEVTTVRVKSVCPRQLLTHRVVNEADRSTVLMSIGTTWCSGVIISDRGHILTVAHLLESFIVKPKHDDERTDVRLSRPLQARVRDLNGNKDVFTWMLCDVVHICTGSLDLALVRCRLNDVDETVSTADWKDRVAHVEIDPASGRPRVPVRGEPVIALGHSLYGPSLGLRPSVTTGVIAKVAGSTSSRTMIQTSTTILRGHSGGALIRCGTDGRASLVGIITSHAKMETDRGRGYQDSEMHLLRLNFCVSVEAFWPLVELASLDDGDIARRQSIRQSLQSIESSQRESDLWALRLTDDPVGDHGRVSSSRSRL
eukprot:g79.t1